MHNNTRHHKGWAWKWVALLVVARRDVRCAPYLRLINLKGDKFVWARAKPPTGQTVLLKKVFLGKLDLFNFFFTLSACPAGRPNAVVVCFLPPALLLPHHSPWLDLGCHQHLLPLSSAAVVVCRCRCHLLPQFLSTAAIFCRSRHHRHSAVSTFSCHPLLSFPIVVHRQILHAVVFRCYHCPPLPSSSAAAIFHHHMLRY